jgi:hypothetical protein
MRAPAIVPTITQKVRTFLAEQGGALRPWTGLQETYDELYALLRRRRSTPEFWPPLKGLLQEVIDNAAASQRRGLRSSAEAELLASWQVDELVNELRDALPVDASGSWSTRTDFTRRLSSAVLGGFLLLGLAAAGCGSDSGASTPIGTGGAGGAGGHTMTVGGAGGGAGAGGTSSGVGGAGGTALGGAGGAAGAGGTGGDIGGAGGTAFRDASGDVVDSNSIDVAADSVFTDMAALDTGAGDTESLDGSAPACTQTVAPDLDRAIGESSLPANQKSQLCQCFAKLSTGWTTSLTQLFATATPQEISTMLSGLTPCCQSTGITSANPSSTDLSRIKSGAGYLICAVPVYKGVSFPE